MAKAIEVIIQPTSADGISQVTQLDLTSIQNKLSDKKVIEIESLMKGITRGTELTQKLIEVSK